MSRALIVVGAILVAVGLAWPWLDRTGIGRLPGDIVINTRHARIYFPIVSCLIASAILSLALWFIRR